MTSVDVTKPGTLTEVETPEAAGDAAESPQVTDLVGRAKAGDADAFAGLMGLYERRIIALGIQMGLSKEDSLDACQDAFIKVFKYIGRFETGRLFFKWLYRIAIHAIYDQLRRSRGAPTVSLEELDATETGQVRQGGPTLHDRLETVQLAARVRESLACLSRQERIVFVLRDLQELSSGEIGTILGISQVTVRRHCMAARQKIRERIFPRQV